MDATFFPWWHPIVAASNISHDCLALRSMIIALSKRPQHVSTPRPASSSQWSSLTKEREEILVVAASKWRRSEVLVAVVVRDSVPSG